MMLEIWLKLIGTVVATIALVFTGYQIRETNKTLIFTTEQNLYKESRDLLRFIADHPDLMQAIRSDSTENFDQKEQIQLSAQIGILLSFYNSMLLKKNEYYISEDFRNSLISDFCGLARLPQISKRLPDKAGRPFDTLATIKRSKCNA